MHNRVNPALQNGRRTDCQSVRSDMAEASHSAVELIVDVRMRFIAAFVALLTCHSMSQLPVYRCIDPRNGGC